MGLNLREIARQYGRSGSVVKQDLERIEQCDQNRVGRFKNLNNVDERVSFNIILFHVNFQSFHAGQCFKTSSH